MDKIALEPAWKEVLKAEFEKPYIKDLKAFLLAEKTRGKVIYPKGSEIFNAFNSTSLDKVKVVILGQDPYHGPNQAHGLCFSVQPEVPLPPSLVNIFKELKEDLGGVPNFSNGCLLPWAREGVLLLNSILTVEAGKPTSHQNKGWEQFTTQVIEVLSKYKHNLVFILWGSYAQNKCAGINLNQHLVLKAAHPSPLSAHRGFFGSRPFSKANQYLIDTNQKPINWLLASSNSQ